MQLGTLLGAAAGVIAGFAFTSRPAYAFTGRVVLITGGSRGLGLVLARQLVHEHGARVVLVARTEAALARAAQDLDSPDRVHTIAGDVRSSEGAERIVARAIERFGALDVLVNNAGVITSAPFGNTTDDDFRHSLEVHLWGVLHMSRAALPHLPRPDGKIVNICSIGGRLAIPHLSAYCVGKFAQAGLSTVMAEELHSEGITVSTVYPGLMRTGSHVHARFRGRVSQEYAAFAVAASTPVISMGAERAARQILRHVRSGRRQITIPWTVRQVARAATAAPNLTTAILSAVDAVLPGETGTVAPAIAGGEMQLSGPVRVMTTLGSRAATRNNEEPLPR